MANSITSNMTFKLTFGILVLITVLIQTTDSIRCYECRSDVHRSCGDPFFASRVPAVECSHHSTQPTLMCFKATQFTGGTYTTVRGCAPFNTETFGPGFQRGMAGTFWRGQSSFSLCDFDNCNSANGINLSLFTLVPCAILMRAFS